ncbi:MAG: glycosyl hydrolase family 28 protein [Verrucomicrobiae bacterium]|nr:glycosyl hydrolase family 28 protein [Verrucomicrobiae bacterium]
MSTRQPSLLYTSSSYNIKDHGGKGDGKTKDTAFIQQTIDACARAGGGTVYFPPGIYLTGTICLKNNVTLWLEAGATILGSADLKWDYDPIHLIYARKAKNISICGQGTISGNLSAFERLAAEFRQSIPGWTAHGLWPWRPRCSVHFFCCDNVRVDGVSFVQGGATTLGLIGCTNVDLHHLKIDSWSESCCEDAINILSCRQVHVTGCSINSSDDPICIYQGCPWFDYPLGDGLEDLSDQELADYPNEGITISDCVLRTRCNGIRVNGSRGGKISNVCFNNIVIDGAAIGINIKNFYAIGVPPVGALTWNNPGSTEIENVSFSNMMIRTSGVHSMHPFLILNEDFIGKKEKGCGNIRNISFSNCHFCTDITSSQTLGTGIISGSKDLFVDNIAFSNVELEVIGRFDEKFKNRIREEVYYPFEGYRGELYPRPADADFENPRDFPYGIYCRYARNLRFHDVVMRNRSSVRWKHAARFDHVTNPVLRHLDVFPAEAVDRTVVGSHDVTEMRLESGIGQENITPNPSQSWNPPSMYPLVLAENMKSAFEKQYGDLFARQPEHQ